MKNISTATKNGNEIFKELRLTIGLDLGDRTSHYCILDEAGTVILEHNLPTTPKGIQQTATISFQTSSERWEPRSIIR
jgi:transposase